MQSLVVVHDVPDMVVISRSSKTIVKNKSQLHVVFANPRKIFAGMPKRTPRGVSVVIGRAAMVGPAQVGAQSLRSRCRVVFGLYGS